MPDPRLATPEQRFATRRRSALRKQARRRLKRREQIMAGLTDRFTAAMLDFTDAAGINSEGSHVPLELLPTRKLRARVAELNRETESLHLAPPTSDSCSRPDPALMAIAPVGDANAPAVPNAEGHTEHAGIPTAAGALPADILSPAAVRRPRRRGRKPAATGASIPIHPYLPDQEAALREILALCTSGPAAPGIGRRHPCPCYHRAPENPKVGADPAGLDPRPLTVHPTAAGDLVFRCHRCGFCLDSVEFLHHAGRAMFKTLAEAAEHMVNWGLLTVALPPAQLAGYERLEILRHDFEAGRARYKQRLAPGRLPVLFGDWALLNVRQLAELFPDRRLPKTMPAECLGRLGRDFFGRINVLDLHTVRCFTRLYRLELRDWEEPSTGAPLVLFTARWADYLEWRQLVVCDRHPLARELERALARWPDAERLPLAMLDDRPVRGQPGAMMAVEPVLPLAEVWLALRRDTECATAGLSFCGVGQAQTVVRVRRLPPAPHRCVEVESLVVDEDRLQEHPLLASRAAFCHPASAPECVEDVADTLVAEKEHQPLAVALADALNQACRIHPAVRQRLMDEVAARAHIAVETLVEDMDMNAPDVWPGGPYALNAPGGTRYVARAGRYWRRGSREKDWSPVTNFRLRLVGGEVDTRGRVIHHGRLEIGGQQAVEVVLSTAVLESPKRLITALTKVAVLGGLDYPTISDPKARRLLPELVKATQS